MNTWQVGIYGQCHCEGVLRHPPPSSLGEDKLTSEESLISIIFFVTYTVLPLRFKADCMSAAPLFAANYKLCATATQNCVILNVWLEGFLKSRSYFST